jgi:hypothetical protein
MSHQESPRPVVFTPFNEPYLGRESVFAFDNLILACLETSSETAPRTHKMTRSALQTAACQLIPQSISIALSIRELVRQGHLFGALVLMRSLAERTTILLYLYKTPSATSKWERGWRHRERPSLAAMLNAIGGTAFPDVGPELTRTLNSITHGDPDSGMWNLIPMHEGGLGHAVSKMLNSPDLCDKVCMEAAVWLSVVMGMINAIFPVPKETDANTASERAK